MPKLAAAYAAQRADLVASLAGASTPGELVECAELVWRNLAGPDSPFALSLTPREYFLLTTLANPAFMALGQLLDVKITLPAAPRDLPAPETEAGPDWMQRGITMFLAAGTAAFLPAGPLLSALAGTATGSLADMVGRHLTQPRSGGEPVPLPSTPPTPQFGLDRVRARLPQLFDMLAENYDRLLAELVQLREEIQRAKLQRAVQIEELPNVLAFLHEAMEAPDGLDERDPWPAASTAPGCLAQRVFQANGIAAMLHVPGENDELFEDRNISGRNLPVRCTLRPALVRDGTLLARGIIPRRP